MKENKSVNVSVEQTLDALNEHNFTPKERVLLGILAWRWQFDNPPAWRPVVSEESGVLYLDGRRICDTSAISSVGFDVCSLRIFTVNHVYSIQIDWEDENSTPDWGEVLCIEYPSA